MDNSGDISRTRILDKICDDFEAQWSANIKSDFESFLKRVDAAERGKLIPMLLEMDIELRLKSGQQVNPEDYRELRNQVADVIDRLVSDPQSRSQTRVLSGTPLAPTEEAFLASRSDSQRIGPFKLLQQIGEGGMGTVWMADQEEPVRRRVALKLIKKGLDNKQVIARFEAERQALAMMSHRNIAKVLDAESDEDGSPYFVMELVQGIPITDYCDRNKLTPSQRLALFMPVCKAVQHAHQKGIVHRDLKPSNVLVCVDDGEPTPKVIDFGLAKALQHQTRLTDKTMFTEFGQVVGTVQYMSPEQATMDAMDIDTRTDVYSLGVMLYELLTGSTPIEKDTLKRNALFQVLEIIREKEPPRPSNRLSSSSEKLLTISEQRQIQPSKLQQILRGDLDWIIMKALEKDRTRRYETANDLAEDVRRYLEGESVEARPPSKAYKFGKFVKKNRGLVAAMLTIAILLAAGISGSVWFAIRAESARARADKIAIEAIKDKNRAKQESQRAQEAERRLRTAVEETKAALSTVEKQRDELRTNTAESYIVEGVSLCQSGKRRRGLGLLARVFDTVEKGDPLAQSARVLLAGWNDNRTTTFYHPGSPRSRSMHRLYSDSFASLSPLGKRIITSPPQKANGEVGDVLIWNAETGQNIGPPLKTSKYVFSPTMSSAFDRKKSIMISMETGDTLWSLKNQGNVTFSEDGSEVVVRKKNRVQLRDAVTGEVTGQEIDLGMGGPHAIVYHSGSKRLMGFTQRQRNTRRSSADLELQFWNSSTGERRATIRRLIERPLRPGDVQFMSGNRVVVQTNDAFRLWNVESGAMVGEAAKDSRVDRVTVGKRVPRIAIKSADRVRLINTVGGSVVTEIVTDSETDGRVNYRFCGFSPGEEFLILIDDQGRIRLVQTKDGAIAGYLPTSGGTLSTVWSPDGKSFATVSSRGPVKQYWSAGPVAQSVVELWDPQRSAPIGTAINLSDGLFSVLFTDNDELVTVSSDGQVRTWDTNTGRHTGTFHLEGQVNSVKLASSDTSKGLLVGIDNRIEYLRLPKRKHVDAPLPSSRGEFTSIAISNSGDFLVAGRDDWTADLWDLPGAKAIKSNIQHSRSVSAVGFSRDDTTIATGSSDATVRLWNVKNKEQREPPFWHRSDVTAIVFHPNGKQLFTATRRGAISVWNVVTGRRERIVTAHEKPVLSLAISPGGQQLLTGSEDETVRLWNANTLEPLRDPIEHDGAVGCLAFHPDGQTFASATSILRQWSIDELQLKNSITADQSIVAMKYSHDGTRIASVTSNGVTRVWDAVSTQPATPPLGDSVVVRDIEFTKDDSALLLACHDGVIRTVPMPLAVRETPERLRPWVELTSTMSDSGQPLTLERWLKKQAEFFRSGTIPAFSSVDEIADLPNHPFDIPPLAARVKSAVEMQRRIMLAMLPAINGDRNKYLPAVANFNENGEPLLSWRVHILPNLGEKELYEQFRLDEPWDSEHNKKLIEQLPDCYRHPLSMNRETGKTNFVVPAGEGTCFFGTRGRRAGEIADGVSRTIALLSVNDDHAVIWTEPKDVDANVIDPNLAMQGLVPGRCLVAFADGHTFLFPCGFPEEIYPSRIIRWYITCNGGETLPGEGLQSPEVIEHVLSLRELANWGGTGVIAKGSAWRFSDDGHDLGASWREADFDDSTWSEGRAVLGYGANDEATTIRFGPDADNKFVTTYFRRDFDVTDAESVKDLFLRLIYDDGVVVYLNGQEVVRENLPSDVHMDTLALKAIAGAAESRWHPFLIETSHLKSGMNVLAVELHQSSRSSSDLRFDLELNWTHRYARSTRAETVPEGLE